MEGLHSYLKFTIFSLLSGIVTASYYCYFSYTYHSYRCYYYYYYYYYYNYYYYYGYDTSNSAGLIVGCVVGGIIGLSVIGFVIVVICQQCKKKNLRGTIIRPAPTNHPIIQTSQQQSMTMPTLYPYGYPQSSPTAPPEYSPPINEAPPSYEGPQSNANPSMTTNEQPPPIAQPSSIGGGLPPINQQSNPGQLPPIMLSSTTLTLGTVRQTSNENLPPPTYAENIIGGQPPASGNINTF